MFRLFVFIAILICPCLAVGECNPADDPCAKKKEPGAWDKSLAFGFNLTQGNSDTLLATIGFGAKQEFEQDIWDFGLSYNYGEDDARVDEDGEDDEVSRNDFRANGSYNYLLTDRFFVGFGSKVLYDEIADIDYRVNLDPTVGYYLVKDDTYKFRLEGGPSYIFERVGDVEDDYFAPRVADRFDWVLSCTSKLFQTAEVLFDINDSDNYIVNAEIGVEAALTTTLSLVVAIRENYDNQPAEDREKDDLAVLTSLKVAI